VDEYFDKVVELLQNNKKVIFGRQQQNKRDEDAFTYTPKTEYHKLMQHFQQFVSFLLLTQDIMDKPFYLPCYMDNRGRQYYGTLISPTFLQDV
jgi:hypothetical protein